MSDWKVLFHSDFEAEFDFIDRLVKRELLSIAIILGQYGPALGRPFVDTLKGSKFSNMKEIRFRIKGEVWRFAFAFDSVRSAIVLVGGDKRGKNQQKFYSDLIKIADFRFEAHLTGLKN
ncbi:MAG: type II toxin-antitoxin system RelE/ParE family toxin [Bdellovibrionota bacterium]